MTALHQFRGSLTSAEVGALTMSVAREIKGTRITAILLVVCGVCTILGLIALALGSVPGALQWLVLSGAAAFALGALAVLERRRQRTLMQQEIRGSIGPHGVSVIDRGLPILHDWSVVRSVESSEDLLIVRLSDETVLPLSPRMFASVLEFESAAATIKHNVRSLNG